MQMDKETSQKLEAFHKTAALAAEVVLFRDFPIKIVELHQLIEATSSPTSIFHLSHASSSTDATVHPSTAGEGPDPKKRKLDSAEINGFHSNAPYTGRVLPNSHLKQVHETVKRECEHMAESCDKIKLWVNLSMPKIEDGDNFGVQIQEEVLNELHRSQEAAYNLRDAARQDYLARAKICSKLLKYPNVEDYVLALQEHDEKQLYVARQNLIDLRNMYAILTDIMHKNISKIRTPKANNSVGLY
ncbi:hypothetical protein EUX98_g766 [Antrodiella citrinella]|uniref:Proteasome activator PA28 C-terminal domain-containing protein n=1 Tax=Antrodiella citrinella TaxID=2447956 RepID=A0A4S4N657_9APHY|nr:hypothetical protein EUX98_g766 [Antrodiella citrinella]